MRVGDLAKKGRDVRRRVACIFLACGVSLVSRAGAIDPVVHVDCEAGRDSPDREGRPSSPFRTLGYALSRIDEARLDQAEVFLSPCTYADLPAEGAELFPVVIPPGLRKLRVFASAEGAEIRNSSADSASLVVTPGADGSVLDLVIEGITFQGGRSAAALHVAPGQEAHVGILRCSFRGQDAQSLGMYLAGQARGTLEVRESGFREGFGGVSVEAGPGSRLGLVVEGSSMVSLRSYGPLGLLGAGVELHVDPAATVEARVERNEFRAVASAVQITASEEDPDAQASGGSLQAAILGNLVAGVPAAGGLSERSVANGMYLSLWPHHQGKVVIAGNTIVGVRGSVLHTDNLEVLRDLGRFFAVHFVNNICWRVGGASEFDLEGGLDSFPPPEWVVSHNLLEKSRLGLDEVASNFSADPQFQSEAEGNFRLLAGSPAVDRGSPEFAALTVVDLDGGCRRASSDCILGIPSYPADLGAYEVPGLCDQEVEPFRRGDCNQSGGEVEISDAVFLFSFLFLGSQAPACRDACDSNDDGRADISDGIHVLVYLFTGGPAPLPPFPEHGTDPTRDCLIPCKRN